MVVAQEPTQPLPALHWPLGVELWSAGEQQNVVLPMVIPGDLLQTWFVRVTGFPAMAVDAKVLEPGARSDTRSLHGCVSSRARYRKRQLARPLCSLYVPGSNRSFEMSRYGRPDRHHGEI